MTMGIYERYSQMIEVYLHALNSRSKLLMSLGIGYGVFTAVFIWTQTMAKSLSMVATFFCMCFTALFWITDYRYRSAIRHSKQVGMLIEEDVSAGIPCEQRYFSSLEERPAHDVAIDFFVCTMILILSFTCVLLFYSGGKIS